MHPDHSITIQRVDTDSSVSLAGFLKSSFMEAYRDVHSMENIEAYCNAHFTRKQQERILADPAHEVFAAFRSGKIVGALIIYHHGCPLQSELNSSELKQLYLGSSEYGTGLGKSLIAYAYRVMTNAGKDWIWLCVSDLNHRAQRFYKKSNFQKIGEGPILEVGTDRLTSSIMIRPLRD